MFRSNPCLFIIFITLMPASHGQFPVRPPHLSRLYGSLFSFSLPYICQASPICLRLLRQLVRFADSLARASAGKSSDARMAIMAMTTSSSIKVNARIRSNGGKRFFFIFQNSPGRGQTKPRPWTLQRLIRGDCAWPSAGHFSFPTTGLAGSATSTRVVIPLGQATSTDRMRLAPPKV